MSFPVLVKLRSGSKVPNSHYIIFCNNEDGLIKALSYEGFRDRLLLVQSYVAHFEQVYKVYGIREWFTTTIALSIPHKVMKSQSAYPFDSQKKFEPGLFTNFSKSESRVDEALMKQFFAAFYKEFNLKIYGVDIIVDQETGVHYVIDCNYYSSYSGTPEEELTRVFDGLIYQELEELKEE